MSIIQQSQFKLATSSIEEGLDFAASLLAGGIETQARADPAVASELAVSLAQYTQFRYVGEFGLAFEELAFLGKKCQNFGFQRMQFWSQLNWAGQQMNRAPLDVDKLANSSREYG